MPVADEDLFEGVQIPKQAVHTAKVTGVKQVVLEPKLTEDQLTDLMKHDLWLDSETVMKYGFADEII